MNETNIEFAAPKPIEDQPVAVTHPQPAIDDIKACALLDSRTDTGYELQVNVWLLPADERQIRYWAVRKFAIIDLGGYKYNKNGFKSATEYAARMYVQGDRPLTGFTMDPLTMGERALIELANINNASGSLKEGSSHRLAWLLRRIYSIFPSRERQIINESIKVIKTWLEIYDIMVEDHARALNKKIDQPVSADDREQLFAPYLNSGKKYLKENHLAAFSRFNQHATEDFAIGQYLCLLAYWANLTSKDEDKEKLAHAVEFWMEMVAGVKQAKEDAAVAHEEKRGLSVEKADEHLMVVVYDVPKDDEMIASTLAAEIFNPRHMGFDAQALIMRTPDGKVNVRYNKAAAAYFDLKKAAEYTFNLLSDRRYGEHDMWHLQESTLFILNGSLMHASAKTSNSLDQMVKMVFAGLRRNELSEEEVEPPPARPLRQSIGDRTENRRDRNDRGPRR